MFDTLLTTLNIWLSGAIGRLLAGAGLTFATATAIKALFDNLLEKFLASLGDMPEVAIAIFNLGGIDIALSYIISALIARQAINSARVFIARV